MAKTKDYVPGSDAELDGWLDNAVGTLPTYSTTFNMDAVDAAYPFNGVVPAGNRVTALYGRFPASLFIQIQNTGTVSLDFGMEATADAVLSSPNTIAANSTIQMDITALGGIGKPYFIVENSGASDGNYLLNTSRLGRMINAADTTLRELREADNKKNDWQAQVEVKDAAKDVYIGLLRNEFQSMKKDKLNYTSAIGDDLKIIAPPDSINPDTATPAITATKKPEGWAIHYNLLGFFDGIEIHRKRPTDPAFCFWKTKTTGKFVVDTDAMVNGTQYKAWFMISDARVGQESDILTISV